VIQSIPFAADAPPHRLHDSFPRAEFDVARAGIRYFAALDVLAPWQDRELLYWRYSHSHWTPLAHRLAGAGLAAIVAEELERRGDRASAGPPR
jgi:hypothetical protein